MRKIIVILLLGLLVLPVVASEPQRRFSAGISYTMPVGSNDALRHQTILQPDVAMGQIYCPGNYNIYWGVGLEASYALPVYGLLQFQPSVSFDYSRHHGFYTPVDGVASEYEGRLTEIGFDVCIPLAVRLDFDRTSLEIGTGPTFGTYFYQKNKAITNHAFTETMRNVTRRFQSYWRFYAKYNFFNERLYAKVSYDCGMSHYFKNLDLRNQMVFGVGMNF